MEATYNLILPTISFPFPLLFLTFPLSFLYHPTLRLKSILYTQSFTFPFSFLYFSLPPLLSSIRLDLIHSSHSFPVSCSFPLLCLHFPPPLFSSLWLTTISSLMSLSPSFTFLLPFLYLSSLPFLATYPLFFIH